MAEHLGLEKLFKKLTDRDTEPFLKVRRSLDLHIIVLGNIPNRGYEKHQILH